MKLMLTTSLIFVAVIFSLIFQFEILIIYQIKLLNLDRMRKFIPFAIISQELAIASSGIQQVLGKINSTLLNIHSSGGFSSQISNFLNSTLSTIRSQLQTAAGSLNGTISFCHNNGTNITAWQGHFNPFLHAENSHEFLDYLDVNLTLFFSSKLINLKVDSTHRPLVCRMNHLTL